MPPLPVSEPCPSLHSLPWLSGCVPHPEARRGEPADGPQDGARDGALPAPLGAALHHQRRGARAAAHAGRADERSEQRRAPAVLARRLPTAPRGQAHCPARLKTCIPASHSPPRSPAAGTNGSARVPGTDRTFDVHRTVWAHSHGGRGREREPSPLQVVKEVKGAKQEEPYTRMWAEMSPSVGFT